MADPDGVVFVDSPTRYEVLGSDLVAILYKTGTATIEFRQTASAFLASAKGHDDARREIFKRINQ